MGETIDYPNLKNLDGFNTQEFDGWGISTNKKVKNTILGDTAFLIVGIGSNPKKYYLWSRFIIDEIIEKKDSNSRLD